MIWLELRAHDAAYNPGWNSQESAWAPIHKKNGSSWPFWNLLSNVSKNDIVFHLQTFNNEKRFIGYSTASTDGYITSDLPSYEKHDWDFVDSFHKVELSDFKELKPYVLLSDFFTINNQLLRDYFIENKLNKAEKVNLFYTIQNNRLQCLNGAYFSAFNTPLPSMLLNEYKTSLQESLTIEYSDTRSALKELYVRIGHQKFSDNVKSNFSYKCCFPNCDVEGKGYLISGHIDRWSDNESMRGKTGNGLCLCLMHDKAFEKGAFTLNEKYQIVIMNKNLSDQKWLEAFLKRGENLPIKARHIDPLIEALRNHWRRIGYEKY
ncbi:hypothetical protein J2I47_06370 [Fibrella sp. HMF5335]|uniref:HNH endonuclease n=1 Tax=Fibrella rubiginis TaxID=2817060 RepID=A0A939GD49_9BACT|nr:HNH endonuclease [Fibrella rubiginis]MBO0936166.1 hypothetical protein [Fibrella rubiginis]